MITEIGIVSGEILNLLDEKKHPLSVSEIKSHLDEPVDVINMSIGWLIRENYVRVARGNEKYLLIVTKNVRPKETFQNV